MINLLRLGKKLSHPAWTQTAATLCFTSTYYYIISFFSRPDLTRWSKCYRIVVHRRATAKQICTERFTPICPNTFSTFFILVHIERIIRICTYMDLPEKRSPENKNPEKYLPEN